ncbi:outer membrane lipoprotein carrier protein LolA [Kitasatospora sp. NPDC088346]|uniref:LolA family protein n=1 Tax=Kitasatospora sp. NPDC088346 TaxID=3364073 RepID=UPI00380D66C2
MEQNTPRRTRRRTTVRVLVPVGVAAAVAAGVGLVPALASDSQPNLPPITAEQLVAKVLGSETDTFSGTVKVKADLGLPTQLLGMAGGGRGGSPQEKAVELLGGEHTLQVAADGPDRQRVGLLGNLSGYEVIHNGDQVWAWDSVHNEAYHATAPKGGAHGGAARTPLGSGMPTPQELARQFLAAGAGTTSVTVDGTVEVAGRAAYKLSVKPTQTGSTIREVRISVDAERGVPLAVLVQGSDGSRVLDAHFGSVSFARPAAKTFEFSLPKGAKVTEAEDAGRDAGAAPAAPSAPAAPAAHEGPKGAGSAPDVNVVGEGWTSVLTTRLPDARAAAAAGEGAPGKGGHGGAPQNLQSLAGSLGKPVGGGTLVSTKLLNVLITDDGRVFAGAVTLPVLQSAAGVK